MSYLWLAKALSDKRLASAYHPDPTIPPPLETLK